MGSMLTFNTTTPISVPDTKVFVRHEVEIVWPDGTVGRIHHDQDVTAIFQAPANDGLHMQIMQRLRFSRVNARINYART